MEKIAATISNPISLLAFVVAAVLTVVFLKTKQDKQMRWFVLALTGVTVVGGLGLAYRHTVQPAHASGSGQATVQTTGSGSPIVLDTKGNVTINQGTKEETKK